MKMSKSHELITLIFPLINYISAKSLTQSKHPNVLIAV